MDLSDLDAKIQAGEASDAVGPVALQGLGFASVKQLGAIPAVVQVKVESDVDEPT